MNRHSCFPSLALFALAVFVGGCAATSRTASTRAHAPLSTRSVEGASIGGSSIPDKTVSPFNLVSHQHDEADLAAAVIRPSSSSFLVNGIETTQGSTGVGGRNGLTLEAIERLAIANNPAIHQATANSSKARAIRNQVGLKPNPSIGYFAQEIGNEGAGGLHGVFISQKFVRGDKLELNRRVLNHDVNATNWQTEVQRQRTLTDVRLVFYDALAAQRRLNLAREFAKVAKKGVDVSTKRVEAKIGTRADVLQSEVLLNEVNLSVQRAEFELGAAWKELAALSGVPKLQQSKLKGSLTDAVRARDFASEFARISGASPQLLAALAGVDRARANLHRQRAQTKSNVTAQLGVGADDATGTAFANVQLSMPLPFHNKNQGNVQAAQAQFCAAAKNVERIRLSIRRDLARVMREHEVAEVTVRRFKGTILPKLQETLKLMEKAQAAGEFDFLRVLTARQAYFDGSLRYVTAQRELAKANAIIDGLLLSDGLSKVVPYRGSDNLRGQALGGE